MSGETFTKHNPGRPGRWEEACLNWLDEAAATGGVPVAVVRGRSGRNDQYLQLQRVTSASPTKAAAEQFGRQLAVTHTAGAAAFGAAPHGWEGSGYQGPNSDLRELPLAVYDSWGAYYAEVILRPLNRAIGHGGVPGTGELVDRLIRGDFDDGRPAARLHGDLWSGNVMWSPDGVVLIDPSSHGGHGLTDLGFLTMFGAPYLDTILGAYAEAAGLSAGWRELLPLHRLHVLFLHAAVFGGGYVGETESTVGQVLTL